MKKLFLLPQNLELGFPNHDNVFSLYSVQFEVASPHRFVLLCIFYFSAHHEMTLLFSPLLSLLKE